MPNRPTMRAALVSLAVFLAQSAAWADPAPAASAKPPAKPAVVAPKPAAAAPKPPLKPLPKPTRPRPGRPGRPTDPNPRHDEGVDSPEHRALRDAEHQLFPLPLPDTDADDRPRVDASGLPPVARLPAPAPAPAPSDEHRMAPWIATLQRPDLPVRWDPRVLRYLEYFKEDPRGRGTFALFYRRSGRYRELVRRVLHKKGLPEDLIWLALVESGFDPTARSPAGAVGLWQFVAETARSYGLTIDRWLDQRLDVTAATEAATDFLADLRRRFGSWDLAIAAYNMGAGGMAGVVRRYNTNDFWALSHLEGSLPWETTLYVPRILSMAVVAHNLAAFGFGDLALDPSVDPEEVHVPAGTTLALVASAANCPVKDLETLNPELRAGRTPPPGPPGEGGDAAYVVKVPSGKGATASQNLARLRRAQAPLERYVVRFGETLEQIASARKTTVARLAELNGIAPGEAIRGGTVILVPKGEAAATSALKPAVVVPTETFASGLQPRVFYRVVSGDGPTDVAAAFRVSTDSLRRWNGLDPDARLLEGMTLQVFVDASQDLGHVVAAREGDVRVLVAGSDDFFGQLDATKGRHRQRVVARAGETLEGIGRRYNVPAKTMERLNRKGRSEPLRGGDTVIVPVAGALAASEGPLTFHVPVGDRSELRGPIPLGPLPKAPFASLLPTVLTGDRR